MSFANMQCSVRRPAITLYYHISFDLPVFLWVFFNTVESDTVPCLNKGLLGLYVTFALGEG